MELSEVVESCFAALFGEIAHRFFVWGIIPALPSSLRRDKCALGFCLGRHCGAAGGGSLRNHRNSMSARSFQNATPKNLISQLNKGSRKRPGKDITKLTFQPNNVKEKK